ncbi:uncharacterized protein [Zea mays]|nr:uncharacterized protein LOC103635670 [Zea mays]
MEQEDYSVDEVYAVTKAWAPNNGILISGCQTNQTTADATTPLGVSFGALSNSIQTILANEHGKVTNEPAAMPSPRRRHCSPRPRCSAAPASPVVPTQATTVTSPLPLDLPAATLSPRRSRCSIISCRPGTCDPPPPPPPVTGPSRCFSRPDAVPCTSVRERLADLIKENKKIWRRRSRMATSPTELRRAPQYSDIDIYVPSTIWNGIRIIGNRSFVLSDLFLQ